MQARRVQTLWLLNPLGTQKYGLVPVVCRVEGVIQETRAEWVYWDRKGCKGQGGIRVVEGAQGGAAIGARKGCQVRLALRGILVWAA